MSSECKDVIDRFCAGMKKSIRKSAKDGDQNLVLFKKIEKLLLEMSELGYFIFVNDGTVQFFKGNPPRDRFGAVISDKSCYNCDPQIKADGGATL